MPSKNPLSSSSASEPKKHASSSPSPATIKNISYRRGRSPLSDNNSGDASFARAGCFGFLLSSSKSASAPRTPFSAPPYAKLKPRRSEQEPANAGVKKQEPAKKQSGRQLEALTPEASTPASGSTPPVNVSVSPEVACGGASSFAATPGCYAAGHHVLAGVHDQRKCRPKGILNIAGEWEIGELGAHLNQASIHWLSSPSEAAGTCLTKCGSEPSVNWLVFPREGGELDSLEDEIFLPKTKNSSYDAFWRFSPDDTVFSCSPVLGGLVDLRTPTSKTYEKTPSSSGFLGVRKTPSSGEGISPFSLILKRVASSFQKGGCSYRYGSAVECTPLSGESWLESTDSAICSGLTATGGRSATKMDQCLEMMSLSPKPGDDYSEEYVVLPAPLPDLSLEFAPVATPPTSIDLSSFKRPLCDMDANLILPETQIS